MNTDCKKLLGYKRKKTEEKSSQSAISGFVMAFCLLLSITSKRAGLLGGCGGCLTPFFEAKGPKEKALRKENAASVGLCAPRLHSLFEKSDTKTENALRMDSFAVLFNVLCVCSQNVNNNVQYCS